MVEQHIGQARHARHRGPRTRALDRHRDRMSDIGEIKRIGLCRTDALVGSVQCLQHVQRRRAKATAAQHSGQRGNRRAVAHQHQQARARGKVWAHPFQRRGMEAETDGILQCPTQARGGEAEGGGRWMRHPFIAGEMAGHAAARPEPKRIARRQHHHLSTAMRQQQRNAVGKGHWPFDHGAGNRRE